MQSSMVSPFSVHQQQLMMLAQQQSLLMAAAAKSAGGELKVLGTAQQPGSNGSINLPTQSWANAGYQMPGMVMPCEPQTFNAGIVHSVNDLKVYFINFYYWVSDFVIFLPEFRQGTWCQHIQWAALFHILHLGIS